MEGLGAFGQFGEVPVFQGLGERVEQAPDVTTLKGIMTGLSPFMKHIRDQTVGAHADIGRPGKTGVRVQLLDRIVGVWLHEPMLPGNGFSHQILTKCL
jgi:hypothetical protein